MNHRHRKTTLNLRLKPALQTIMCLRLFLIMSCIAALAGAAEDVRVNKTKPTLVYKYFDPAKPPAEMPRRSPSQGAITTANWGLALTVSYVDAGGEPTPEGFESSVTITSVFMKLELGITIWLPNNPDKWLREHEEGHRRISERYYSGAEKIAKTTGGRFVGKTYTGKGKTAYQAQLAARTAATSEIGKAYLSESKTPSLTINEIYDRITQHGANTKVTPDEAIEQAYKEYESGKSDQLTR